ncbi:MAG: hypothetical protein ACTTKL_10105 [Treponema sp.]
MKRYAVVLSALLCSNFLFYAEANQNAVQVVFPKKIFVGTPVEIQYAFSSGTDFFPAQNDEAAEKPLIADYLPFDFENDDFSLQKAALKNDGVRYSVALTLIPWRTGVIDLPPFNLYAAVSGTNDANFTIDIEPFEVASALNEYGETSMQKPLPPLLLPGTAYALYALSAALLLLIFIAAQAFKRREKIAAAVKSKMLLQKYAKNARKTLRALKRLSKRKKLIDADFCQVAQNIMRAYLNVRFGEDFTPLASFELPAAFERATGGFLDGERREKTEDIVSFFRRADYIRFAQGSSDAQKLPQEQYAARLQSAERQNMIASLKDAVLCFDSIGRRRD